jgi:hypothetical protein
MLFPGGIWMMTLSEQYCSDLRVRALYRALMARDFYDSLEVISNLLYLIRMTLHDPAAANTYVDLAEERVRTIELKMRLSDVLTCSSTVHDKSCESANTLSVSR